MKLFLNIFIILTFLLKANILLKSQDFEVKPMTLIFNDKHSEKQVKNLKIKNFSNQIDTFIISDFHFIRDSLGKMFFNKDLSNKFSITKYLSPNKNMAIINPGDSIEIDISFYANDTIISDLWGGFYIKPISEQREIIDNLKKRIINVSPQIAAKIYYINPDKSIKSVLKFEKQDFSEINESFAVYISNPSNKIIRGKLIAIITNISNANEDKYELSRVEILPSQSTKYYIKLNLENYSGKFSISTYFEDIEQEIHPGIQSIVEIN